MVATSQQPSHAERTQHLVRTALPSLPLLRAFALSAPTNPTPLLLNHEYWTMCIHHSLPTPFPTPCSAGMVKPPAMVVEYMGARSLRGCLNRGSDMLSTPLSRVMVALDVAKGMEYLHNKSVVHLDLKSGNVRKRPEEKKGGMNST